MTWTAQIVEGYAETLRDALNRFEREGWRVVHVLPNGVNRWTVTAAREAVPGLATADVPTEAPCR